MKVLTRLLLLMTVIGLAGCVHQSIVHAPMQPDGWSAQPLSIACRFAPDADLDSSTGTPVGDEGYYLYILTDSAGNRDYSTPLSVAFSFRKNPGGHSWIILESPQNRLEYGHNGNFGLEKPHYLDGVYQRFRDNHPNPIAYLWEAMDDGRLETGRADHTPTFVWRMPITKRRYELIYEYAMQRTYDQFNLRDNNCTDMVTDAAALAGIHLIHRLRLTIPQEPKILGRTLHMWTDPKYRILEFSTPDVLQMDLRQLAQLGIGSDVTEWYPGLKR
ncbi:MAG: hypothetical protein WA610_09005 [Thermodesulfovibrionales bacterium]